MNTLDELPDPVAEQLPDAWQGDDAAADLQLLRSCHESKQRQP